MYDIAYLVEASIEVAEKGAMAPIPPYDILAAFYVDKCIRGLQYWSIWLGTHGV